LNRRITGNSAPISDLEKGYFRIMPIFAPWGQTLKREVILVISEDVLNPVEERIFTTCPCARRVSFFMI